MKADQFTIVVETADGEPADLGQLCMDIEAGGGWKVSRSRAGDHLVTDDGLQVAIDEAAQALRFLLRARHGGALPGEDEDPDAWLDQLRSASPSAVAQGWARDGTGDLMEPAEHVEPLRFLGGWTSEQVSTPADWPKLWERAREVAPADVALLQALGVPVELVPLDLTDEGPRPSTFSITEDPGGNRLVFRFGPELVHTPDGWVLVRVVR